MSYFKVKEQSSTPVDKVGYIEVYKFQLKLVQQCKELPNPEEDMALVLWKSARIEPHRDYSRYQASLGSLHC